MSKHSQCEDRRMECDQDIINSKFWLVKQLKETRSDIGGKITARFSV